MYFFNSFIVCSSYYFGFTIFFFFFFFNMRTFYKTWQIEEIFCCSFEIRGGGDVNNWKEQEWKCCKITDHEFKVKKKESKLSNVYLNWKMEHNNRLKEIVSLSNNQWMIDNTQVELFVQKESHCLIMDLKGNKRSLPCNLWTTNKYDFQTSYEDFPWLSYLSTCLILKREVFFHKETIFSCKINFLSANSSC